jgi:hypothetical protein
VSAVWFDLAADPLNEGPYVVRFLSVLSAPDRLQHLLMQQDLARIPRKIGEHFELAPRERHVDSVHSCATRGEVDL